MTHRLSFTTVLLLLAGCASTDTNASGDTDETSETGDTGETTSMDGGEDEGDEADTGETDGEPETARGVRICELNELYIDGDALWLRVWNDVGLHDCPDEWLAAIDPDAYGVGGPRWRSVDSVVPIGDMPQLGAPQEVPPGLGYSMVEAANVELFPLAGLEEQFGTTIETLDDIPAPAFRMLLDTTLFGSSYVVSEVQREFTTEFVHFAGQRVFVLDDGQCQYAMKYYTSIVDPELVDEDAVATLGDRLTQLPEGFSFSVEVYDEDLVIVEDQGVQYVITDEFGNSYDRFACD